MPFVSQCSVNAEIVGGGEVHYDASGLVRPFLVIRAVCVRPSAGFVIQQVRGSVQVVRMGRQWREGIVVKRRHTVVRLAYAMVLA